jgi:regulator of protease activity HflC (stomatin/prohibitin superfamily)
MGEQYFRRSHSFVMFVFSVIVFCGLTLAFYLNIGNTESFFNTASVFTAIATLFLGYIVATSIKVANQWEKAVVLRLGKFYELKGPGLFFLVPIIDAVSLWVDTRVMTSTFTAEKTLTKDTVPVNVDAVIFWKVLDSKMAALNVVDYESAIGWASKTALRDVIGRTMLSDMLEGREKIGKELQVTIDERAESWGIKIISVEIKDVLIPSALENAMSMQAQAERERQARVILGDSERQVAEKFGEASKTYLDNPIAFHLRAMNMLYEGLKQNSTIVVVPSSALESMELGSIAGLTALAKQTEKMNEAKKLDQIAAKKDSDLH